MNRPKHWVTRDGRKLRIREMTDDHVLNTHTHRMLQRGHPGSCRGSDMISDPCIDCWLWMDDPLVLAIAQEHNRRGLRQ